ncbi:HEAT repeat domain-containing protein, partial [Streptomyces sp. NPDC002920]
AMAYHAGAELTGIECFQINPLIKDYNGPACAYVANPFGGYQVNRHGERFVDSDYWSGQMMAEFAAEVASDRGPVYLKLSHLPEESISALESILHSTERPTRGTFHSGRGHDYRTHDIEMHISEIGLCGGHSASGVRVDDHARTTVPGLYAAGDLACVPHNYMIGAFVFGELAGADAARYTPYEGELPADQLREAHELVYRPLRNPDGPPQTQVEYKLRRFVNDYVAPPKSGARLSLALEAFDRMREDIAEMGARTPHELMRCAEVTFIRDCAEMAARASLARTESRWGLYHDRLDHPSRDDASWFHHLDLHKSPSGAMEFTARPVAPYLVPVDEFTPVGGPSRQLGEVHPEAVATAGSRDAAPVAAGPTSARGADSADSADCGGPRGAASPRLLELLALAEEEPELAALDPYLTDLDPAVRRTAVSVLTETVPPGTGQALAGALGDADGEVRATASASLRELVETLPAEPALRDALAGALDSPDPVVRATALDVLRALRLGDAELFAASLDDPDIAVRIEAVRALVSVDAAAPLARAADDASREVRVAVAKALAGVDATALPPAGHDLLTGTLDRLTEDADALVRGAAYAALGTTGCPAPLAARAVAALADPAWQVRSGAATALSSAAPDGAVPALAKVLADPNADVRKAAVLALTRHRRTEEARAALATVTSDSDADVRAYATRAL